MFCPSAAHLFLPIFFVHSDEALLEVITDSYTGVRRSSGASTHSRFEESTLSSTSMEDLSSLNRKRRPSSYPTANTPLLMNHVEV